MNFIIIGDQPVKRMKIKGAIGLIKITKRDNLIQKQYKEIRKKFPDSKITYIYGFDKTKMDVFISDNLKKLENISFVYNKNYTDYDSVYSLSLAAQNINRETFVIFGNNTIKSKVFDSFFECKKTSRVYVNQKEEFELGCSINNKNYVENICYNLSNPVDTIYYFNKEDSILLRSNLEKQKYRNYFLFEIINIMIDKGSKFQVEIINNQTQKISKGIFHE